MARLARVVVPQMPLEMDEPNVGQQLQRHENTGRPLGEKPFLERIGKQLGRNLIPGKGGRPRKNKNN